MPTKEHGHIVETAVEARGGFLGRPVAVVLVASTAAVVVGSAFDPISASSMRSGQQAQ